MRTDRQSERGANLFKAILRADVLKKVQMKELKTNECIAILQTLVVRMDEQQTNEPQAKIQ